MVRVAYEFLWAVAAIVELFFVASLTWLAMPLDIGDSESRLGPFFIAMLLFQPLVASIAVIWGVALVLPRWTASHPHMLIVTLACTGPIAFAAVYSFAWFEIHGPLRFGSLLWMLLGVLLALPRLVTWGLGAAIASADRRTEGSSQSK
jgi:FlaA1/EpsC-like NDP-sugar epimerase